MKQFTEVIVRTGIFMVCARMLVNLRLGPSYDKYLKILSSIMVFALILFPLLNLFAGEKQSMEDRVTVFEEYLSESNESPELLTEKAAVILRRMTESEVEKYPEDKEETAIIHEPEAGEVSGEQIKEIRIDPVETEEIYIGKEEVWKKRK